MKIAIAGMRIKGVVLPKSKLGIAIGYLENNWETLITYLTDGHCPIDNNLSEQLMKHTATGRKNWLFSDAYARRMKILPDKSPTQMNSFNRR